MTKIKRVYPLIIIALILLFNPNANIIDILPDCIAYLLLILAIGNLTDTVPYLAECRDALIKLSLVTAIKIPAFTIMHSNMVSGRDIVPLFTLAFTTLELILLYSAINNGYKALCYLGERTDCHSVRESFPIGRGKSTPEALRILTFIFFAARGLLSVVPELLLLTPEDYELRKKLSEAYPAVLVICILASLVIGIIWLRHAMKYTKAIKLRGDIADAIESLKRKESPEEISTSDKLKKLTLALTLFAFSSVFIFDITLSNFGGYNILPHFIYGILVFASLYTLTSSGVARRLLTVGTAGYTLTSLIGYFLTMRFCQSHAYIDLKYSSIARSEYLPVKIFAVSEALFAILMLAASVMALIDFVRENTDVAPSDPSYSRTNNKNHKLTIRHALPVFVLSAIIHIMKCLVVFLKQSTVILESDANSEGIVTSSAPMMDTVIFFICIIYVIYCFVVSSNLKDEVKFKYGKEHS